VGCLAFLLSGWRLGRIEGSVFLIAYAAYIVMLFNRGHGVV
jgi:Ca2+/Na+ antiporter